MEYRTTISLRANDGYIPALDGNATGENQGVLTPDLVWTKLDKLLI
ncbi:MAG: hypothetical protein V3U65_12470 [Granulosicoccaceae bacterium]